MNLTPGMGSVPDGFPRTIPQAEALESITEVSTVISIEVPDEDIVNRIVGRRMDPENGEIYHITFKPPPTEVAHRLVQRKDDNEETVRMRLSSYHEQTKPLGDGTWKKEYTRRRRDWINRRSRINPFPRY